MVARLGMDHFLLFGQKRPNPTHFPHFTPARPDSGEKNWQSPAKEKIEKLEKNIARTAKAALHKCPGKTSLNVNHVCPVLAAKCLTYLKNLNGSICKEIGGCMQVSWRLSDLIEIVAQTFLTPICEVTTACCLP